MPKNVLDEPPNVPTVPPRPSAGAPVPSFFSPLAGPPNLPPPTTFTAPGPPLSYVPPNDDTKQEGPHRGSSDPALWKPFFNEQGLASPAFTELLSTVFKRLDPNNTGVLTPEAIAEFCSAMGEIGEENLCKH